MIRTLVSLCFCAVVASGFAQCCKEAKVEAKVDDCCSAAGKAFDKKDAEFLKLANQMMAQSEGGEACCKTTAAKVVVKGADECCNSPKADAKFKVFVAGEGYKYFGCKDSAAQGRKDMIAAGHKAGSVQKVRSKRLIVS